MAVNYDDTLHKVPLRTTEQYLQTDATPPMNYREPF
ncbi:hypothetical protein SNOG_01207 [Parastagonospora nodorum SN15]|uniref:Uncharacterized protein n=1 Tax=Phaeosphaeria nodorum (strain SN15 / ATCC MYA-4574 / FGSC 10173) TaxID=321614 RepID=Q0V457_PHANO|nr:hypothetical protein SNOG_01207 [Parastagonospora nodorum SN15]EAT90856.1 hypothetical protein SNOG_01207 [Parastagonospora nodorum SN15]